MYIPNFMFFVISVSHMIHMFRDIKNISILQYDNGEFVLQKHSHVNISCSISYNKSTFEFLWFAIILFCFLLLQTFCGVICQLKVICFQNLNKMELIVIMYVSYICPRI